jgi:hypothetical protein
MTWYNISTSFSIQADEEKAEAISDFLAKFIAEELDAELRYVSVLADKERPDTPEPEPEKPDAQVIPFRPRNETL